jgi:hypothetical protein
MMAKAAAIVFAVPFARGRTTQFLDRSIPVKKAYDDALVAIYQNGERLMPGNGYPMRLLVPGYQGNMNVKFLRRIKAIDQPAMTFFETKNYLNLGRQRAMLPRVIGSRLGMPLPPRRSPCNNRRDVGRSFSRATIKPTGHCPPGESSSKGSAGDGGGDDVPRAGEDETQGGRFFRT